VAEDSVITEEMRSMIDVESDETVYEIEKEPIRRWADAIGDPNPLYRNEEYAKKKRYRSIIGPPAFVDQYSFPVKLGQRQARIISPFTRKLNGGDEYEFFIPVQAGDTVTSTTKLVELLEREGRLGKMLIQIYETTYKNQNGEAVVKSRNTDISY